MVFVKRQQQRTKTSRLVVVIVKDFAGANIWMATNEG
jgi:hypothetical protein